MITDTPSADDVRKIVAASQGPALHGHLGALHLGELAGRRVAVKTVTGNPLAACTRRWVLRREHRAYRLLQGVEGVPRCYGLYEGRYLVIEAIAGTTFRYAVIEDREAFYRKLFETIDGIHARGVAHGDLMHKDNILVDEHGSPVLVDFGLAIVYRDGWHPLNHLAYRFFRQHDLNAWLKYKYRRRWERMSPEDARYYRPLLLDDLARRIKRAWSTLRGGSERAAH